MSTFRTLHPRVADNILNVADLAELNAIGDPQLGDFRFVVAEDTLYVYTSGGWEISGAGGGGIQPPDPATSTDNAIVRWDGTDASAVQNSVVTVSDSGAIACASIDADANTITNIENADIKVGAAIDAAKISNGSVNNTEFGYLNGVTSAIQTQFSDQQTDINSRELASNKGIAGGYASLDGGGKVPIGQLPASLMTYEGTWDASTNTPTLANGTGDAGMVYIVNVAGTVNFGAGNITFAIGDWVIYNGSIWQKSDNADDVVSVNGFTGVVVLDYDNVNAVSEMGTVVDNRLVRTNGTTGDLIQQSGITIDDSDVVSGITQLNVDNLRVDGNTISATSGDVNIDAGSNAVSITTANVLLRGGADLAFYDNDDSNAITISVPTNVTSNRTPQIPDDTGNFVLTSATQTLTSKDIDGGTASNTSRLTVPKETKANLDALTRKEATLVYATDNDKVYVDDGSTLREVGPVDAVTSTSNGLAPATGTIGLLRLGTQNGYGSTNTTIRRFTTVISNNSDATYADSSTLGGSITINVSGIYSFSYTDSCSTGCNMGISLNSAQLTTNIATITQADRLVLMSPTGNDTFQTCAVTLYLPAGSVIRAHGDGTSAATSTTRTQFTMQRLL